MHVFATIFEVLTVLGGLLGGAIIVLSIMPGNSGIQTASVATVGIGLAVVPYCIAGAFHRAAMRSRA